jgi:metal-sulfur cluster biosynthetic enzyme
MAETLTDATRDKIVAQLETCRDPEIGLDIMSLGLVYELQIDAGNVLVKMTLTAIGCPWAQELFDEVKAKVEQVEGVKECKVELVYSPPWSMEMMSEEAKLELGFL